MSLNHLCRIAGDRDAFDDIRIESTLSQKFIATMSAATILLIFGQQFFCRVLKDFDEFIADDLALLFRINDPAQEGEETLRGINIFELHVEIFPEDSLHDFLFAGPKQSVVNENAGQLITNRLVQQGRDDRGINTAAETKHHFVVADLSADTFTGVLEEGAHRPIHRTVADVINEILQNFATAWRVRYFRMELQPVKPALRIFNGGKG